MPEVVHAELYIHAYTHRYLLNARGIAHTHTHTHTHWMPEVLHARAVRYATFNTACHAKDMLDARGIRHARDLGYAPHLARHAMLSFRLPPAMPCHTHSRCTHTRVAHIRRCMPNTLRCMPNTLALDGKDVDQRRWSKSWRRPQAFGSRRSACASGSHTR